MTCSPRKAYVTFSRLANSMYSACLRFHSIAIYLLTPKLLLPLQLGPPCERSQKGEQAVFFKYDTDRAGDDDETPRINS